MNDRIIKFRCWFWDGIDSSKGAMISGQEAFSENYIHFTKDGKLKPTDNCTFLMQFTGLKDKNGKEGYFDCDIWEIKNYKYDVKWGAGFRNCTWDLRFVLHQGLLEVEYELINAPEDLTFISLKTIFNLPNKNGKRLYVDDNRQNLEIISSIHEHPDLLKQ